MNEMLFHMFHITSGSPNVNTRVRNVNTLPVPVQQIRYVKPVLSGFLPGFPANWHHEDGLVVSPGMVIRRSADRNHLPVTLHMVTLT